MGHRQNVRGERDDVVGGGVWTAVAGLIVTGATSVVGVASRLTISRSGASADPALKTNNDQVIKLPDFVISILRWHVEKQMVTRDMERSELLFPSETGGFRSNSALSKPFKGIAKAMGLTKQISPKAMRRSFQDAMREAQIANVVVRSISGHLTEQMQQRYSTARGHEQENAIARIIDLTSIRERVNA